MINWKELLEIQREFDKRIEYKPSVREYLLAIRTEMFELYNATEIGKWWKIHKGKGRERILDECADVIAFCLSLANTYDFGDKIDIDNWSMDGDMNTSFEQVLLFHLSDSIYELDYIVSGILYVTIKFTQLNADCNIEEIEHYYKNKMITNHKRQDQKY